MCLFWTRMELSRIPPCVLLVVFLALAMETKETEATVLPYKLHAGNSGISVINAAVPDSVANSLASQHETGGITKSLEKVYGVRSRIAQSMIRIFSKLTFLQATLLIPKHSIESEYVEFVQRGAASTWRISKTSQLQNMYGAMFSTHTATNEEQVRDSNTAKESQQLTKRNRTVRPEISQTTTAQNAFKDPIRGIKLEAQENFRDQVMGMLDSPEESPEDESSETSDASQLSAESKQVGAAEIQTSGNSSVAAAEHPQSAEGEQNGVEGEDNALSTEREDHIAEEHAAIVDQNTKGASAVVPSNPGSQEVTDVVQTVSDIEEAKPSMSTTGQDSRGNETQSVVNNNISPGLAPETVSGPDSETSRNTEEDNNGLKPIKPDAKDGNKSPEPSTGEPSLSKGTPHANDQRMIGPAEESAETGYSEPNAPSFSKDTSPENEQKTTEVMQGAVSGAEPNEPEDDQKQSYDAPDNVPEQATAKSSTDSGGPVQKNMEMKSQIATSERYKGSKSGLVKGENTTQLSLMVYKVAKSEKILSMAAAPCREVSHWMPEVAIRLEFEIPEFRFYCIDTEEPPGSMEDLKQAYGEISGGFLQAVAEDVGQAVPKNMDLVVSWMGMQQWGIRKSWRFIKGLRRGGVRMALFSNNPMSSNADLSAGTLNVRKSPMLFNEAWRIFRKVSTDDNKQLVLYSMDGVREGF